jgi:cation diffusion facilitator CzcD-associated flavoprotein CzcO
MGQRTWTEEEQRVWRSYYPALFAAARKSAVGLPCVRRDMRIQDVSPSERERYFEELWACGGVHFLLRNFNNVMIDKEANKTLYEFWKKKVRERLTDTKKQALMAPDEMPYFFSTRRTPLEHDYYEVLNRESVDIVDIKQHPIESFTERGLKLGGDEQDREYDHIVCATGFDSFTGSLTTMGLVSKDGIDIKDVWRDGVRTYLGLTIHGFSNAFMVYSPQAPTALSNAPTLIECQVDFICDTILALRQQGAKSIEATSEAEEQWKEGLEKMVEGTLYPYTSSWWNTSNVPGKKSEQQNYILGIKNYEKQVRETMEGWKGFDVVV